MITLGSTLFGSSLPVEGRIRDLSIFATHNGIEATYTHEGATNHHAVTYLNGTISAIDKDGVTNLSQLSDGFHNINIVPQLEADPVIPIRFDESDGQHVLLTWAPSTENIAGYKIYQTDLAGENPELLTTISTKRLEPAILKYPTTGTGSGRITANNTPLPAAAYGLLTITITGTGAYSYTLGDESGSGEFYKGAVVYLAYGASVQFTDDLDEYETGDTFSLSAGPENRWLSPTMEPGEYRYAVSAYDSNGYESDLSLSQVYEVVQLADPVSDPVLAWNNTTKTLTIPFTLPANAVSVNLYSNFEQQESEFTTYTSMSPQDNHTSTFSIEFDSAEDTFKYYLRPVTAEGVELEDYTLRSVTIPAVGVTDILGTPENLQGSALPTLNWSLSWDYEYQESDDLVSFEVYRDAALITTIPVTAIDIPGAVETFSYSHTAETEPAGDHELYVTATSTNGAITTSETITITTHDTVAITAPTGINGGAA